MDLLSLNDILDIIENCTHLSDERKKYLTEKFKSAVSHNDIPDSVFDELQDAVAKEVNDKEENLTKIEEEMEKRRREKRDLEAQNLPNIKKAAKVAVREMDNIVKEFKTEAGKIEDEAVKVIEHAKGSSDKSEADSIRKKLGIA
ncbi:MAG: hypothetical protein ACD_51C00014G0002 [uncultured bacterium]|nr:MAG: hypothetical protein ACD_51C00014G0002 [uncultured bacterium]OGJ46866.1 MAG: hypothetical protein A2244_02940 [Candidatus Peregrinibacteria bacterium RIFOXYA2_FULL_41_18]OGJ48000.1 MAG: hypothetical protein A2344_01785 [Candidatus Peregrinibacteria bacterium RIFOXYB12_FULL_41_12]OGJ51668.1 MAG: hypothetical protein A2336_01525 [Candidatus Peregrinibacteria bacterium RIFOXYB2_FULL_41_88]